MKFLKRCVFFVIIISLFIGCKKVYTPKPRGYFRIDLPQKKYKVINTDCPYQFEIPVYANISEDPKLQHPCWLNIKFPRFNATIHLSYAPLKQNDLGILVEDTYKLAYKHSQKADGIKNIPIQYPEKKVSGILYDIKGNVASSKQFFLTDSTTHYLRGALYFYEEPNKDSIAPVLDFIHKDIEHLINSFQWK